MWIFELHKMFTIFGECVNVGVGAMGSTQSKSSKVSQIFERAICIHKMNTTATTQPVEGRILNLTQAGAVFSQE